MIESQPRGALTSVPCPQREMEDAEAWAKQTASVRREREQRLEQVKRTARGFLDLAKASLSALLFLTSDAAVAKTFAAAPDRAKKLASMLGKSAVRSRADGSAMSSFNGR